MCVSTGVCNCVLADVHLCIAAFAVSELTAFVVSVYWQHLVCLCNVYWQHLVCLCNVYWQQLIYELAVVCICWQRISPLSWF